jgi:hypothetical protein
VCEMTIKKLSNLQQAMQAAFEASEWQVLADLDKTCLSLVKEIIQENPRAMFDELRVMLGFYKTLVADCEAQRGHYAKEVAGLRRSRRSNQTYHRLQGMVAAV